ncbi:MAG: hypothetical protein MUC73_00745 [Cyclobacteriaceae bacterium]|jgi:hypothetical protein|nr:hypothetical protein [Cyclobacteriaceae bacterium]
MKKVLGLIVWGIVSVITLPLSAQKIDDARMQRDIEVAENVLKTLIQQQFDKQRMFFGLEVDGSYQPGYGVTFRLPADFTLPIAFSFSGEAGDILLMDGQPGAFTYSFRSPSDEYERELNEEMAREMEKAREMQGKAREEQQRAREEQQRAREEQVRREEQLSHVRVQGKAREARTSLNADSLRKVYNDRLITAAKDFLVDYGDLISQLGANERIVITNRGEQPRVWVGQYFSAPKRSYLSIEMLKSDMSAHKQGKLTREQALSKVSVVSTEAVENAEPDLELLTSIFNRLYRPDLATTYFTDEGIYYERLKDFGAVYYMRVYSSNQSRNSSLFNMPTAKLNDVDQAERDKKVKEMYPSFEKELKENIVEYGRTVKSLGDNESLIFNIRLTRCEGCGIPSTLELSIKGSALKEYSSGKITKEAAIGKISVKKGPNQ